MRRSARVSVTVLATAAVATAAFGLGRATGPPSGHPASTSAGDYFDGLRVGRAEGREQGRAEQQAATVPSGDRAALQEAFTAGYASGMNDVFAGYDGGWALDVPWIVTLERGSDGVAYRIAHRTPIEPGVDYYLCADAHDLCQRPR